MNTQYELVSQKSPVTDVSPRVIDDLAKVLDKNDKENDAGNSTVCSPNVDRAQHQYQPLEESHASDFRLLTTSESASSRPETNKVEDEAVISQNDNQSLYQKLISSFPMSCLLEIAGTGRHSILALILELTTYGDYRDTCPNYQIPNSYRRVFDELCAQWSRGTSKNEFRKAFLAYVKEKLEAQMSTKDVGENISHASSELFEESTFEVKSGDAVSRCIDEVALIQESSKNLLRQIFGRAREILNQLKGLNLKLQTENVKLRSDLSKISEKLREIETQNQSIETDSTSYGCINQVMGSNQDEIFKDLDCADLFGDTAVLDLNQVKMTNDDLWICCERNSIVEGQSLPEPQGNDKIGNPRTTYDACVKCLRLNNEKRFYIIREQIISVGCEKFREIANVYAETGDVILPSIPHILCSKTAQEKFSPAINTIEELIPSLSDAIPLSESTFWDIDPAQAATWSTQISDSALGLEPHTMERLSEELGRENPYILDCGLSIENKDNLDKVKVTIIENSPS